MSLKLPKKTAFCSLHIASTNFDVCCNTGKGTKVHSSTFTHHNVCDCKIKQKTKIKTKKRKKEKKEKKKKEKKKKEKKKKKKKIKRKIMKEKENFEKRRR